MSAIICDYCQKITPNYVKDTEYHIDGGYKDVTVCKECHEEYFNMED